MVVSIQQITWGFNGDLKDAYYGIAGFDGNTFTKPISVYIDEPSGDAGKFAKYVFEKVDSLFDVDFSYALNPSGAIIQVKNTFFEGSQAGLTTTSYGWSGFQGGKTYKLDIKVEYESGKGVKLDDFPSLSESTAHTILHEVAHALGLDHPDDDPYGKWHDTADTVMSYNYVSTGSVTPFYTTTDLDALKMIWKGEDGGSEIVAQKGASKMVGTESSDAFVFKAKDKFGKKGADLIVDFSKEEGDGIVLGKAAFPGLEKIKFKSVYNSKQLKAEQSKGSNIIYYDKGVGGKGALYFDQNGSKKGYGKGGLFAYLADSPGLTKNHFSLA